MLNLFTRCSNIVQELFANSKEGDILRMEVLRNGRIVKLKAPMMKVEKRASHLLSFDENAAESQLQIREAWLGNN